MFTFLFKHPVIELFRMSLKFVTENFNLKN